MLCRAGDSRDDNQNGQVKTNADLQHDVLDEPVWDPSINAANLPVTVDHGTVTLGGSRHTEKWAANRSHEARTWRRLGCK